MLMVVAKRRLDRAKRLDNNDDDGKSGDFEMESSWVRLSDRWPWPDWRQRVHRVVVQLDEQVLCSRGLGYRRGISESERRWPT